MTDAAKEIELSIGELEFFPKNTKVAKYWKKNRWAREVCGTVDAMELVGECKIGVEGCFDVEKLTAGCVYELTFEVIWINPPSECGLRISVDLPGKKTRWTTPHFGSGLGQSLPPEDYLPSIFWRELTGPSFTASGSGQGKIRLYTVDQVSGLVLRLAKLRPVKCLETISFCPWDFSYVWNGKRDCGCLKPTQLYCNDEQAEAFELVEGAGFEIRGDIPVWKLIKDAEYEVVFQIMRRDGCGDEGWDSPLELYRCHSYQGNDLTHQVKVDCVPKNRWVDLVAGNFKAEVFAGSSIRYSLKSTQTSTVLKGFIFRGVCIRKATCASSCIPSKPCRQEGCCFDYEAIKKTTWKKATSIETNVWSTSAKDHQISCNELTLKPAPTTKSGVWKEIALDVSGKKKSQVKALQLIKDCSVDVEANVENKKLTKGCIYEAVLEVTTKGKECIYTDSRYIASTRETEIGSYIFQASKGKQTCCKWKRVQLAKGCVIKCVKIRKVTKTKKLCLNSMDLCYKWEDKSSGKWCPVNQKSEEGREIQVTSLEKGCAFTVYADIAVCKLVQETVYEAVFQITRTEIKKGKWESAVELCLELPNGTRKTRHVSLAKLETSQTQEVIVGCFKVTEYKEIKTVRVSMRNCDNTKLKEGLVIKCLLLRPSPCKPKCVVTKPCRVKRCHFISVTTITKEVLICKEDGCPITCGDETCSDDGCESSDEGDGCESDGGKKSDDGCESDGGKKSDDGCESDGGKKSDDGCESDGGKKSDDGCESDGGKKSDDGCESDGGKKSDDGCESDGGKKSDDGCESDGGKKSDDGCESDGGKKSDDGCESDGGKNSDDGCESDGGKKSDDGCESDGGKKSDDGCESDGGKKSDDGCESDGGKKSDDGCESDGGKKSDDGCESDGGKKSDDGCESDGGKNSDGCKKSDGCKEIRITRTRKSEKSKKTKVVSSMEENATTSETPSVVIKKGPTKTGGKKTREITGSKKTGRRIKEGTGSNKDKGTGGNKRGSSDDDCEDSNSGDDCKSSRSEDECKKSDSDDGDCKTGDSISGTRTRKSERSTKKTAISTAEENAVESETISAVKKSGSRKTGGKKIKEITASEETGGKKTKEITASGKAGGKKIKEATGTGTNRKKGTGGKKSDSNDDVCKDSDSEDDRKRSGSDEDRKKNGSDDDDDCKIGDSISATGTRKSEKSIKGTSISTSEEKAIESETASVVKKTGGKKVKEITTSEKTGGKKIKEGAGFTKGKGTGGKKIGSNDDDCKDGNSEDDRTKSSSDEDCKKTGSDDDDDCNETGGSISATRTRKSGKSTKVTSISTSEEKSIESETASVVKKTGGKKVKEITTCEKTGGKKIKEGAGSTKGKGTGGKKIGSNDDDCKDGNSEDDSKRGSSDEDCKKTGSDDDDGCNETGGSISATRTRKSGKSSKVTSISTSEEKSIESETASVVKKTGDKKVKEITTSEKTGGKKIKEGDGSTKGKGTGGKKIGSNDHDCKDGNSEDDRTKSSSDEDCKKTGSNDDDDCNETGDSISATRTRKSGKSTKVTSISTSEENATESETISVEKKTGGKKVKGTRSASGRDRLGCSGILTEYEAEDQSGRNVIGRTASGRDLLGCSGILTEYEAEDQSGRNVIGRTASGRDILGCNVGGGGGGDEGGGMKEASDDDDDDDGTLGEYKESDTNAKGTLGEYKPSAGK